MGVVIIDGSTVRSFVNDDAHFQKSVNEAFASLDVNKDGVLSRSELRRAFESLRLIEPFKSFGVTALNIVRMSLSFYLNYGDGFGVNPNSETKKNLVSLIVDPIPMAST